MLNIIKDLFSSVTNEDTQALGFNEKNLACAALLIEVAVIDQKFDQKEFEAMQNILTESFNIEEKDCKELIDSAKQESSDASSTYQFTQLVNQHCSNEDKFSLLEGMWRIAYADNELDKYEEYIIRKVSDLIHMSHSDFIRAKHIVKAEYS